MAQLWEQEILANGSSEYTLYILISAVWDIIIPNTMTDIAPVKSEYLTL